MLQQNNILLDEDFLITLSKQQHREIYARIISLDINENPIDQIEGKITGGSINVDGTSSVRRTCSLTMITNQVNINDYYWGIKTKFKLEIGLRNSLTDSYSATAGKYPEIVWFPQGYYVISTFNTSLSINNCTISLQGKDKMCLLNGDLGGQLFASIDFGTEETITKTMEEIVLDELPKNSEEIIKKDLWIEATANEIDADKYTNPLYCFILDQKNGKYYKNDNGIYVQLTEERNNKYKYYNIYKKVEYPKELFKDMNFFSKNRKYYVRYPDSTSYYQATNNFNINNLYFDSQPQGEIGSSELAEDEAKKRIYFAAQDTTYVKNANLEGIYYYQSNQYYYQTRQINTNNFLNYYILDTKEEKTFYDRNYYKLVPLYQLYSTVDKVKIPIEKIIREAVHAYAQEPYHNIIIKDLDDYGLEQMTYKGEEPLYALYNTSQGQFTQVYIKGRNTALEEIVEKPTFQTLSLNNFMNLGGTPVYVVNSSYTTTKPPQGYTGPIYQVMKIEYGDDVGYRLTELVYAGDLISSIGDSLTSILDKIKEMLGEFEYFYDLNGRFIFQKKPNYIQTSWTQIIKNEDESYVDYANSHNKFSFNFEGNTLFTALQNTPILNNLRNDYSVWGKRRSATSGEDIPIHIRYAIDQKPIYYKALDNQIYITDEYLDLSVGKVRDWRELIYQMALDYFKGQGCSEEQPLYLENSNRTYSITSPDYFLYEVGLRNPDYYPSGYTGYEQYYTDLQGFWRLLYNPDYVPKVIYSEGYYEKTKDTNGNTTITWHKPEIEDYESDFYVDYNNPIITNQYNSLQIDEQNDDQATRDFKTKLKTKYEKFLIKDTQDDSINSDIKDRLYWNINAIENPATLDFWFDFLDGGELVQFSVPQIGVRSKTTNETKSSAIIYPDVPGLIFYSNDEGKQVPSSDDWVVDQKKLLREIDEQAGYIFIHLPSGYQKFFTISSRSESLKNKLDTLLYQNSYCIENISITSIPIYHLEPNTRIFVQDIDTGINGEYIINRMTIPLNYNGTMSITANKAPQRLY